MVFLSNGIEGNATEMEIIRFIERQSSADETNIDLKMELDRSSSSNSGSSPSPSPLTLSRSYSRWSPTEEGVTIAWRDLSVSVSVKKNGYKRIINCVNGAVKAGSLVALMGSSGAGKSTLMAALANRNAGGATVEGEILINGRPVGDYMRTISGFMHQEDIFVGALTVLEHLNIMARFKLDRRTSATERDSKVQEIIKQLGLKKCMYTKIGGVGTTKSLSGGEKKRLAFATELLTDPPIMFCDEPTTGLDSYSAQKLISMMNVMATNGKTILCTIHQPSSELFAMFSQLLLVADGRTAFMGSNGQAVEFFNNLGYVCPVNYNPAEFFIKTLGITRGAEDASKQEVKRICDHFAVSEAAKEVDVVVRYEFHMGRSAQVDIFDARINFKEAFWWTKLYFLTYRYFLEVLRNPSVQVLRILQKIVIAIMIGLCYFGTDGNSQAGIQSVEGVLFLLVTENTFTAMYSVLAMFPEELPLCIREYHSGLYPVGIYYFAKLLALLPGLIIEPVIFVVVIYWICGLRATYYAFSMTALITTMTMNVSTACGSFFSSAFESVPTAMSYLVPFDYILMITSGVFVRISTIPDLLAWTKYLSWMMYSMESLSIIQWQGIHNITCENTNPDVPCIKEGTEVLEKYNFLEGHLERNLLCIFVIYCIFHVLGYATLWRRIRK